MFQQSVPSRWPWRMIWLTGIESSVARAGSTSLSSVGLGSPSTRVERPPPDARRGACPAPARAGPPAPRRPPPPPHPRRRLRQRVERRVLEARSLGVRLPVPDVDVPGPAGVRGLGQLARDTRVATRGVPEN